MGDAAAHSPTILTTRGDPPRKSEARNRGGDTCLLHRAASVALAVHHRLRAEDHD